MAIRLLPNYAIGYCGRGCVYQLTGQKQETISDYQTFLRLGNDSCYRSLAQGFLDDMCSCVVCLVISVLAEPSW